MKIIIDNGHGADTPGKCAPDGSIYEYSYCRLLASKIVSKLKNEGFDASLLTPEVEDIAIKERVRRANAWCDRIGAKNVLLISIHLNAAGSDGKWHKASGWSGWVSPNSSAQSKLLAQLLYDEAEHRGLKGNRAVAQQRYWVGNFGILRSSKCPAVLTENMFQDSREDVALLLSHNGFDRIVALHIEAIKKYLLTQK